MSDALIDVAFEHSHVCISVQSLCEEHEAMIIGANHILFSTMANQLFHCQLIKKSVLYKKKRKKEERFSMHLVFRFHLNTCKYQVEIIIPLCLLLIRFLKMLNNDR